MISTWSFNISFREKDRRASRRLKTTSGARVNRQNTARSQS
jgi:hypothetical protein